MQFVYSVSLVGSRSIPLELAVGVLVWSCAAPAVQGVCSCRRRCLPSTTWSHTSPQAQQTRRRRRSNRPQTTNRLDRAPCFVKCSSCLELNLWAELMIQDHCFSSQFDVACVVLVDMVFLVAVDVALWLARIVVLVCSRLGFREMFLSLGLVHLSCISLSLFSVLDEFLLF